MFLREFSKPQFYFIKINGGLAITELIKSLLEFLKFPVSSANLLSLILVLSFCASSCFLLVASIQQPYKYPSLELFIRLQSFDQEFYKLWGGISTMKIVNIRTSRTVRCYIKPSIIIQSKLNHISIDILFKCQTRQVWSSQKTKSYNNSLTSYSNWLPLLEVLGHK